MPTTLVMAPTVLLVLACAGCAWLWIECRRLQAQRDQLQNDLAEVQAQKDSLVKELGELRTQIAVAREKHAAIEKSFEAAQKQMRDTFQSVASDALAQSNEAFLKLASEKFKNEQAQAQNHLQLRQQAIEQMVKPLKETLDKYNESLKSIDSKRENAYGQLTQQLSAMAGDQKVLRLETANLVKALRRPEVRGRWGETTLRRVVELAGMVPHCDFQEQVSVAGESGSLRPDMTIRLPNQRVIVIDSKTPLDAFIQAVECGDETQRVELFDRHAQQVEEKIRSLSGKRYWEQFERSPEFVVLFIPGEGILAAAIDRRPNLIESAMEQRIVIATPTTLVSLLKAVALGWREEQIARNAAAIRDAGRELHERLCLAASHLEDVGESLRKAVEQYNKFVGTFESRVMVSARKFEGLGVTSGQEKESLPRIEAVNAQPRELRSVR